MIIPGIVISTITFPGVIVHELAHQICCRLCRIPVFEVKYFRFGNPSGYVIHEPAKSAWHSFVVSVAPFLFNTLLGILIVTPVYGFGDFSFDMSTPNGILKVLLSWISISILMHAFPSQGDAGSLVQSVLKNKDVSIIAKVLTAPVIGLIYLGAWGSVFWLDLIYAIAVAGIGPALLIKLFF